MKSQLFPSVLLLYAFVVFGLSGCTDHPITEPDHQQLRIDKTIQTGSYSPVITQYLFDRHDKPLAVNDMPFSYNGLVVTGYERLVPGLDRPPVTGDLQRVEFNEKGQVANRQYLYKVAPPGEPLVVIEEKFDYDPKGALERIRKYEFAGFRGFFYPRPLFVTVSSIRAVSPTATEIQSTRYFSTGRIGFSCMECYLQEQATVDYGFERREYDTGLNPFYNRYLITLSLEAFEPANLVRRLYYRPGTVTADGIPNGPETPIRASYTYVYAANGGLPVKRESSAGEITEYLYKPY